MKMAQLDDIDILNKPDSVRELVLYSIIKLGYNCMHCYTPLSGHYGLFSCTSLCSICAIKKLKAEDNIVKYVEGV